MTKKQKITAWIVVCLLWELVVVGIHMFMCSLHKFPTLNLEHFGWLIPVFMAVPFWDLFFGIVSVYRKRFMKTLAVMFTSLGIMVYIAYIAFVTLGFADWEPGLYPLISKTESTADYLVLDGRFEKNYDEITKIMPKTIPENARNISYSYEYDPTLRASLSVAWELPENEFIAFKNETLNKGLLSSAKASEEFFEYKWNVEEIPAFHSRMIIEFNDESCSVRCIVKQSYGS